MNFEKNYGGKNEKPSSSNEKGDIFELKTKLGEFDVSVGIERGQEKIRGIININERTAEIKITPEGIKDAYDFLKNPETQKAAGEFLKSIGEKFDSFVKDGKL